jgi:phage protein D
MRPIVQIFLDGRDISGLLGGRIIKGQIVEHEGGKADELSLTISNYDGLLEKPRKGASLEVALGFEETGVAKVGRFIVQRVTKRGPAAIFEVGGEAADFYGTLKEQKTRSWVNGTLGQALAQIAADNGLEPAISGALASIRGNFYQAGVSDIHFVTEQARKYGAIGKVAQGRLVFVEQGSGESASGRAMPTIPITPNDLERDFSIVDQDRPNRGRVKAKHYDRDTGERREIVAGDGDGPSYTFPQIFGSQEEAERAVRARKREFDSEGKTFKGVLRTGRNDATAGGKARTEGFGDDDDMDWVFTRVVHEFDGEGYVTAFECKPPTEGGRKAARSGR